jgi:nucleoid-associated protein YgaU
MPLKIDWHEDDFEMEDKAEGDSLDKYNEEMARDAVGSLFDGDDDSDGDDGQPVVSGFEKSKKPAPPRNPYRPTSAGRERAPGPRVQEVLDGEKEPPRKRDRTHESNPTPRPAVRVSSTPSREKKRPARYDIDEDINENTGVEDDMEAFRSRYSKTQKKGERPAGYQRAEHPASFRPANMRFSGADEHDEDERIPLLHWVFIGVTVVLLVIAVFFAYRSYTLTGELAEAEASIAAGSANSAEITQLKLDNENLLGQVQTLEAENQELEGRIANISSQEPQQTFGPDETPDNPIVTNPSPDDAPAPEATPAPAGGKTYTVVSGDSLAKIAGREYGNQSQANIDKIANANGITNPNSLQIGQQLIIPPL